MSADECDMLRKRERERERDVSVIRWFMDKGKEDDRSQERKRSDICLAARAVIPKIAIPVTLKQDQKKAGNNNIHN